LWKRSAGGTEQTKEAGKVKKVKIYFFAQFRPVRPLGGFKSSIRDFFQKASRNAAPTPAVWPSKKAQQAGEPEWETSFSECVVCVCARCPVCDFSCLAKQRARVSPFAGSLSNVSLERRGGLGNHQTTATNDPCVEDTTTVDCYLHPPGNIVGIAKC